MVFIRCYKLQQWFSTDANIDIDIEGSILEKIHISGKFALQVDESTVISGYAQLLANVRFVDEDVIKENFFSCKRLPQNTTGEEIFRVASDYMEQDLNKRIE